MATFKSILNPDQSVMLGLASGGVIMAIYNGALPSVASIRTAEPGDTDIEASRKMAAWSSFGVLGFLFLLTRDRNAFLIGGLVLAGVDFLTKHANGFNPVTNKLDANDGGFDHLDQEAAGMYPLPEYADMEMGDVA